MPTGRPAVGDEPGETDEERAARLLAAGYGRRRIARELEISEHEARQLAAVARNGHPAPTRPRRVGRRSVSAFLHTIGDIFRVIRDAFRRVFGGHRGRPPSGPARRRATPPQCPACRRFVAALCPEGCGNCPACCPGHPAPTAEPTSTTPTTWGTSRDHRQPPRSAHRRYRAPDAEQVENPPPPVPARPSASTTARSCRTRCERPRLPGRRRDRVEAVELPDRKFLVQLPRIATVLVTSGFPRGFRGCCAPRRGGSTTTTRPPSGTSTADNVETKEYVGRSASGGRTCGPARSC